MSLARKIKSEDQHEQPALLSWNMQQALASLRLEGIALSKETMVDIELLDTGKISKKEYRARVLKRVKP